MCDLSALPTDRSKILIYELLQDFKITNVKCFVSSASKVGDNFKGIINRIQIISNINHRELSSVILKYIDMGSESDFFTTNMLYTRECTLYKIILPAFTDFQEGFHLPEDKRVNFTKCYKADSDTIILEDLNAKGFSMINRSKLYDPAHFEIILENIARLHAISFAMRKHEPSKFEDLAQFCSGKFIDDTIIYGFNLSLKPITDVIDNSLRKKFEEFGANMSEKFKKYINPRSTMPYNVICHGDTWQNNFLFKYKDDIPVEIRFLDWQLSRYCSPITDIAYLLCQCTNKFIRSHYGAKIYDMYYSALERYLYYFNCDINECYPRDIFNRQLTDILPYGLVMFTVSIPSQKTFRINIHRDDDNNEMQEHSTVAKIKKLNELITDFSEMTAI